MTPVVYIQGSEFELSHTFLFEYFFFFLLFAVSSPDFNTIQFNSEGERKKYVQEKKTSIERALIG